MKTIINKYIVHLSNGSIFEVFASNLSGAKAQVSALGNRVHRVERVYRTGDRSVCPW